MSASVNLGTIPLSRGYQLHFSRKGERTTAKLFQDERKLGSCLLDHVGRVERIEYTDLPLDTKQLLDAFLFAFHIEPPSLDHRRLSLRSALAGSSSAFYSSSVTTAAGAAGGSIIPNREIVLSLVVRAHLACRGLDAAQTRPYRFDDPVDTSGNLLVFSPPERLAGEVGMIFQGCFRTNPKTSALNVFEVAGLLGIAYAAADGQPCQKQIKGVLSGFHEGMRVAIRTTEGFVSEIKAVLEDHCYAWIDRSIEGASLQQLKQIRDKAQLMRGLAGELVGMSQSLIEQTSKAYDSAVSDKDLNQAERDKIKALITASEKRKAKLEAQSQGLQNLIKDVEERERKLAKKEERVTIWSAISSAIATAAGIAASVFLVSEGVPPIGVLPAESAGEDPLLEGLRKDFDLQNRELTKTRGSLSELKDSFILLQGKLREEKAKEKPDSSTVNQLETDVERAKARVEETEKEVKAKEEVTEKIFKQIEDLARKEAETLAQERAELAKETAKMREEILSLSKEYVQAETELAGEVAQLQSYSAKDDRLGTTISALSIAMTTMIAVEAIFRELTLFWGRLTDRFGSDSRTINRAQQLIERGSLDFGNDLERSANQWLVLGQDCSKASLLFIEVFHITGNVMRELPSASQCAEYIHNYRPVPVGSIMEIIERLEKPSS